MSTLDELAEGLSDEQVQDVHLAIRAVKAGWTLRRSGLVDHGDYLLSYRPEGITDEAWQRVTVNLLAVGWEVVPSV